MYCMLQCIYKYHNTCTMYTRTTWCGARTYTTFFYCMLITLNMYLYVALRRLFLFVLNWLLHVLIYNATCAYIIYTYTRRQHTTPQLLHDYVILFLFMPRIRCRNVPRIRCRIIYNTRVTRLTRKLCVMRQCYLLQSYTIIACVVVVTRVHLSNACRRIHINKTSQQLKTMLQYITYPVSLRYITFFQ